MTQATKGRRPRLRSVLTGIGLVAFGFVLAIGVGVTYYQVSRGRAAPPPQPVGYEPADRVVDATHYRLAVTEWTLPAESGLPKLAMVGDRLLVASSAGDLAYLDPAEAFVPPTESAPSRAVSPMKLERLALAIPTDMEVFAAAKIVAHESFGVGDLHVEPRADGGHDLYASFGTVLESGCMVLRVAVAEAFDGPTPAQWRTLFDSQPCFPVAWPADRIAGRMRIKGGTLYVTVGYNGIDEDYVAKGNPTAENPQTEGNSYGKIVAIDLASGVARVVSRGHRNPQGLYISPDGTIFETEHGPRGGDELNRIVPGGNYGWPVVTYGSAYRQHSWPPSPRQNSHDGYDEPVFAWVPSIATSEIVGLEDPGFGAWQGDLLVATLKGEAVHRLHLEDGRVVVDEPVPLGRRLRDMVLDGSTIYLSTDDDRLLRVRLLPAD